MFGYLAGRFIRFFTKHLLFRGQYFLVAHFKENIIVFLNFEFLQWWVKMLDFVGGKIPEIFKFRIGEIYMA